MPEVLMWPCFTFGFHPPRAKAAESFISTSFYRCWLFCKHYKGCTFFTFTSTGSGQCMLFNKREDTLVRGDVGSVTGSKDCMNGKKCGGLSNSIDQLSKLSYKEKGYYILNRNTGKCLAASVVTSTREVGGKINVSEKEGKKFHLKWKSCEHRQIQKWIVVLKGAMSTHRVSPDKPLPTVMSSRVVISSADSDTNEYLHGQRICLSWQKRGMRLEQCDKIKDKTPRWVQLIYKRFQYQECRTSIANYGIEGEQPEHHMAIDFRTEIPTTEQLKQDILWSRPCRVKNSSITHGFVVDQRGAPFQLPGENFTIRCIDDFGVNGLEHADEYNIVCSKAMTLRNCVKKPEPTDPPTEPIHITLVQIRLLRNYFIE